MDMVETKRHLKVFLCHASQDKPAVYRLYQRLTKDGVAAWLDKGRLLPGQDWELEIRKAVREADVVVVCHSKLLSGVSKKIYLLSWATIMTKGEEDEHKII